MRKQILSVLVFQIAALAFSSASAAQAPSSVHAPEGWGQCPRCQNNKDRADSKVKYKVEGHAFNPHDLSGVWGFNGIPAFKTAPPMTEWGKQQHAKTMGDKNAAGQFLHSKDLYKGTGAPLNCDPPGWPRLHTDNYLECIRTRQPPVLNPDLGYKIMVAIKLGVDSYREGKIKFFDTAA